jgi:hypothetical protein
VLALNVSAFFLDVDVLLLQDPAPLFAAVVAAAGDDDDGGSEVEVEVEVGGAEEYFVGNCDYDAVPARGGAAAARRWSRGDSRPLNGGFLFFKR